MANKQQIQNAYIDYVLTTGEKPKSVYIFTKENEMPETEFYNHFGSFSGVEESIWTELTEKTIAEIKEQEVWATYSAREKILSFFYSFMELLKSKRSFVIYSVKDIPKGLTTPVIFNGAKESFLNFASGIINQGLETGELADRKFLSNRYKDALWSQYAFILNFWINDSSAGFEKTDEAIEKGINVTFDLFQRSPIDNLLDYGKFLARNGGFRNTAKV